MLIGYVSNEMFTALPNAQLEFIGKEGFYELRWRASGTGRWRIRA